MLARFLQKSECVRTRILLWSLSISYQDILVKVSLKIQHKFYWVCFIYLFVLLLMWNVSEWLNLWHLLFKWCWHYFASVLIRIKLTHASFLMFLVCTFRPEELIKNGERQTGWCVLMIWKVSYFRSRKNYSMEHWYI